MQQVQSAKPISVETAQQNQLTGVASKPAQSDFNPIPTQLQDALQTIIPKATLTQQTLPKTDLKLWLIDPEFNSRALSSDVISHIWQNVPYWIFCWASGLALVQQILTNPELVKDKVVLDFGSGSGAVAIAAKLAGASRVIACDIDPISIQACKQNALLNGVEFEYLDDIFAYSEHFRQQCDLLLAADVLYDKQNAFFLDVFLPIAHQVLVADSRVKNFDHPGYKKTGECTATTWPDMDEAEEFNLVSFYETV